ncbi:hypothetical protein ABTD90_21280, partial [Acinetobacter baumannii]
QHQVACGKVFAQNSIETNGIRGVLHNADGIAAARSKPLRVNEVAAIVMGKSAIADGCAIGFFQIGGNGLVV